MSTIILPETQARADFVKTLLMELSEKTGIPRKTIFSPNRNDRSPTGTAARQARSAVWRKMLRAGWLHDEIAEAFGCSAKNVYLALKGEDA